MADFSGRVALVTGASRKIGAAVAVAIGRRGGSVLVNYLTGKDRAEGVASHSAANALFPGIALTADFCGRLDLDQHLR